MQLSFILFCSIILKETRPRFITFCRGILTIYKITLYKIDTKYTNYKMTLNRTLKMKYDSLSWLNAILHNDIHIKKIRKRRN